MPLCFIFQTHQGAVDKSLLTTSGLASNPDVLGARHAFLPHERSSKHVITIVSFQALKVVVIVVRPYYRWTLRSFKEFFGIISLKLKKGNDSFLFDIDVACSHGIEYGNGTR